MTTSAVLTVETPATVGVSPAVFSLTSTAEIYVIMIVIIIIIMMIIKHE